MQALIDTSFLFALVNKKDRNHHYCAQILMRNEYSLILPLVVLPEITYLVHSRLGHAVMRTFLKNILSDKTPIITASHQDLIRSWELLNQYADINLDFVDTVLVALAERLNIHHIFTLDRRDFSIIRPAHADFFIIHP